MMNLRKFLNRAGLRILPVLLVFATPSRVFADMAWDPSPGLDISDFSARGLMLLFFIFIILPIWLFAKSRMLKYYGESGCSVIVPILGRYLEYYSYWDGKYYWISFFSMAFFLVFAIPRFGGIIWTILSRAGLVVWAVVTVIMRLKTLEAFGQKKRLVVLEFLGLGFVLDCLCALSIKKKEAQWEPEEKQAPRQEEPGNRE